MRDRDPDIQRFLRTLAPQLLCLSPFFWFLELFQNQLYRWLDGTYGWTYPASKYISFYFPSVFLWAMAITTLWTLDYFVFIPRATPRWLRVPLLAAACWSGEWLAGYVAERIHLPMQRWSNSSLVYIRWSAYWLWCFDVLCYDQLRKWLGAFPRHLGAEETGAPHGPAALAGAPVPGGAAHSRGGVP